MHKKTSAFAHPTSRSASIAQDYVAVTKSGMGTSGLKDAGAWGCRDTEMWGLGEVGCEGTRGQDQQTTPDFSTLPILL